jgi:glycosyltransferase involved in cell wall biosynthesis
VKVLHLLDSLNRGGAEMQALDVCRNARRFGLDLIFVASGDGALAADFRCSGVEFVQLSRRLPVDFRLAAQLRQIIKSRCVEIVQGYQAVEGLHLYLATLGLPKVKRALSFQGFVADRKNRAALRFLIPRMHANIVVSEGLQKWLAETEKFDVSKNFHVLYNGADVKRLIALRRRLREELNLHENDFLFGMVANFYRDRRKDQFTVCRALPAVFEKIPHAHFAFVGKIETGAESKKVECETFCREAQIVDRVHFTGGRSDIPEVLASLDAFVFSSLHEGLPVAVSEAMLVGLPCILSDIEPLREISENGRFAEIFPTGNAAALAEKMIRLAQSAETRQQLAALSKKRAEENFSINAHLQNLRKLYERIDK